MYVYARKLQLQSFTLRNKNIFRQKHLNSKVYLLAEDTEDMVERAKKKKASRPGVGMFLSTLTLNFLYIPQKMLVITPKKLSNTCKQPK